MANDFTGDSHCKALWRMESGAETADSKGTNTLTNNNTVVADTVVYKEGAASADFEKNNSESLSITDAAWSMGRFMPTSTNYFDGLLDEVVVFDDILTTTEIDDIRSGTYGDSISPIKLNLIKGENLGSALYNGSIPV